MEIDIGGRRLVLLQGGDEAQIHRDFNFTKIELDFHKHRGKFKSRSWQVNPINKVHSC